MGKTTGITNQLQLIDAVKSNNEKVLKDLYVKNFKKIEHYILKNSGTIPQAKDIYQDAFIAVWRNVKADNFMPLNESALQGYLYQIAKNKWMDYLRSAQFKKTSSLAHSFIAFEDKMDTSELEDSSDSRMSLAMSAFNKLGKPCRELLTKFYFDKQSVKHIAEELNLEEASARNKKYRCMQKLRELTLVPNKN